eukprot:15480420-Alexandrium_andersonii.AAC.1
MQFPPKRIDGWMIECDRIHATRMGALHRGGGRERQTPAGGDGDPRTRQLSVAGRRRDLHRGH